MTFRHHTRTTLVTCAVALALVAGAAPARAQMEMHGGHGALHFMMVFPQGDFKKNVDDLGFGFSGDLGYAIPQLPVVAGLQLGYAIYGSKTFTVPFSETIGIVNADVTTTNSLGLFHLFLRLQPNHGVFRPYIEGLVGGAYLVTSSSITNKNTGEEVAGSTNRDDFAFSYGAGGGIAFLVHEEKEAGDPLQVFIDLRVRYLYGGEATYFRSDAVQMRDGKLFFDTTKEHTSKTDLFTPHLGVTVRF